MILMIDNYDSFTYNLVQYLRQLDEEVVVRRNDEITTDEIEAMKPAVIIISPGPGKPSTAGISLETVKRFSGKIPILGVCLGHQTIAEAFGGDIILAKRLMHGKVSTVTSDGKTIFKGLGQNFQAMRYHSLAVKRETIPDVFEISAESEDGEIMGIRHKTHLTEGVQFHPESIMTPVGKRLLKNFLKIAKGEE
jgi:anthranilate synthase/aminodeoxychorismate synthase-like glutamine amidotransferase